MYEEQEERYITDDEYEAEYTNLGEEKLKELLSESVNGIGYMIFVGLVMMVLFGVMIICIGGHLSHETGLLLFFIAPAMFVLNIYMSNECNQLRAIRRIFRKRGKNINKIIKSIYL